MTAAQGHSNSTDLHTCGDSASAASNAELTAAELRDAIGDILDVCEGWGRPMTDEQKLATIKLIATKAWEGERD